MASSGKLLSYCGGDEEGVWTRRSVRQEIILPIQEKILYQT